MKTSKTQRPWRPGESYGIRSGFSLATMTATRGVVVHPDHPNVAGRRRIKALLAEANGALETVTGPYARAANVPALLAQAAECIAKAEKTFSGMDAKTGNTAWDRLHKEAEEDIQKAKEAPKRVYEAAEASLQQAEVVYEAAKKVLEAFKTEAEAE